MLRAVIVILSVLLLAVTPANAETLAEYCQRTHDPACFGGNDENPAVWSSMLNDSEYMYEILREGRTEEGEQFRPVEPVLLYTDKGIEYWDRCALSRKNLLLTYYGLPFERLAVAVVKAPDETARSVLLFLSPYDGIEVVDCEKDRVLPAHKFVDEGNYLFVAEKIVSTQWVGLDSK